MNDFPGFGWLLFFIPALLKTEKIIYLDAADPLKQPHAIISIAWSCFFYYNLTENNQLIHRLNSLSERT
ncbi:hypothetical protein [Lacrimispora sp. 38-1]|uniref:hypothetical protein n=1 Tax=Lacrimispora sp. 38-1 TaxID=3125778 RepID=UPI003CF4D4F3